MALSAVVKFTFFFAGVVIGGLVVYGVVRLVDRSSGGNDDVDNSPGTRASDSLQFVVVVSRHGNRGATIDYPNDPYPLSSSKYWPYGINALTPVGRKQEYKLGKKVRSLYNGFLPTQFVSEDIYACSDLYERVVMSGDLFLAGLYPPQGFQVWNKNIDWQPIALYTNSSDHSLIIDYCPRYQVEKEQAMNTFLKEDVANISTILNHFNGISNRSYTVDDIFYIFEKVISEITEGYSPLPDIITDIYPEPFTDYYKQLFIAKLAGTDEVSRLWVGNLLGEIVDTMSSKVNGMSGRKISYYSGHDVTIVNLEVALGVPRDSLIRLAKPGSALIVELHQDTHTGEHTVEVLFIDGSLDDLEPKPLPLTCGEPCMFAAFVDTTNKYTNVDYDVECQATGVKYSQKLLY